jgi:uncharacterized membrane protein YbaN (DUF454 family)
MRTTIQRWTLISIGWLFILLGIAGLFLPVLQGVLFLFIGLLILSSEYVWAHRILSHLRARFPRLAERAHAVFDSLHSWLHGVLHKPTS